MPDADHEARAHVEGRRRPAPGAESEWIEWAGGVCPVHPDADVEVRFYCGDEINGVPAGDWSWGWDGNPEPSGMHIIAYRVASRPMTSFLPTLSPAAQEAALAYDGPEPAHGDPAFANRRPITYLASPYSLLPDKDAAAAIVARAAAHLMRNGEVVYSPIVHGHAIAAHGLPLDWGFWKAQCQPFVDVASRLVVLQMDGWGESTGVQWEIGEFRRAGKPVEFMGLDELVLEKRRAA